MKAASSFFNRFLICYYEVGSFSSFTSCSLCKLAKVFIVKFDTVAKFNESVHSSLDALSEAVVSRLEDLLEASS